MIKKIQAVRYHDICMGHRVVGHEGKCRHLHGHNYRITFHAEADNLDSVGRVVDFSVLKETVCEWLEKNWDHKFLAWEQDNLIQRLVMVDNGNSEDQDQDRTDFMESLVYVPFNPTAENIGQHLIDHVAPVLLMNSGVVITKVVVEETRKCSVIVEKN